MTTQEKAEKYAEGYRCPATNENEYCKHDIISAYNNGYTQCQEDMINNVKVTRFEVIDESGRVCTRHNCKVELSYQDDGRTLKVFLSKQD